MAEEGALGVAEAPEAAVPAPRAGRRERPIRNASYLTAASLGAKVFSFVFVLYANRALDSGPMGDYYLVLAYVGLFGVVTDLGLSSLAVRDVSQDHSLAVRYISNVLAVRVLLSALAVGLIVALLPVYMPVALDNSVLVYAAALIPLAVSNTMQLAFQFSERLSYSAVLTVATSALIAGGSMVALLIGHHVLSILLVFTAVNTLNAVVMVWLVYTRFLPPRLELTPRWWPTLLRAAAPFAVLTLLNVIYNYADRQILGVLSGCNHLAKTATCVPVGQYGTAYRPLDILVMVFVGSINAATLPAFNRVVAESRAALGRLVHSACALGLVFGVPTALLCSFYAPEALAVFGGHKSFVAAAPALSILIWAFPLILMLTMVYNAIYAIHLQSVVTKAFAVTLIFNVVGNFLLIPHFSYNASAALTVASEVLNGAMVFTVLRRHVGPLGLSVPAAKMALLAGGTSIVLWLLRPYGGVFVGLPVGALLLAGGIKLLRVLGPTERAILATVPLLGRFAVLV